MLTQVAKYFNISFIIFVILSTKQCSYCTLFTNYKMFTCGDCIIRKDILVDREGLEAMHEGVNTTPLSPHIPSII